ncbi:MAG: hypothetical protein Q4G19_03230 [Clostridia bacterium]|nr:hypothetical protein [Clostridia bacterium]
MRKKVCLALLLAAVMLLSGCSMIVKDEAVDAATEILKVNDTVYTKGEVKQMVDNQLSYMYSLYYQYGLSFDPTDKTNITDAQDVVIESLKQEAVKKQHLAAEGLDVLTEEDEASLDEEAAENHEYYKELIKAYYFADSELPAEELEAEVEKMTGEYGYDLETMRLEAKEALLEERLNAFVTKDVVATDEEIAAEFEKQLADAQTTYGEDASAFANAMNDGDQPFFAPEGVRLVKQILIKFTDEDDAAITAAQDAVTDAQLALNEEGADQAACEEKLAQAEADLQAAYQTAFANIDAAADEVIAQLAEGADWDELMAEKTQDPGMQSGKTAETGYAVCKDMSGFDTAFTDAAMALENVGDVTGKIASELYGYYIIRYVGDVTPGAVEMTDDISAEIKTTLEDTAKSELYSNTIEAWVSEARITDNRGALND